MRPQFDIPEKWYICCLAVAVVVLAALMVALSYFPNI